MPQTCFETPEKPCALPGPLTSWCPVTWGTWLPVLLPSNEGQRGEQSHNSWYSAQGDAEGVSLWGSPGLT